MNAVGEIDRHIGRRLVAARRLRKVSDEWLAVKIATTREQIEAYEQGRAALTVSSLCDIARALRVDVKFFYSGLNSTVSLYSSDNRDDEVRRAVQRIAADAEITAGGLRKRMPLGEAVKIARNICDLFGWTYR